MSQLPCCAICHVQLTNDDELLDNYVYKTGELHYIELMHRSCVPVKLPPNALELLRALNSEFYSGDLADANAFRILPIIADAIEHGQRLELEDS